mmetsp:Transcript_23317/g.51247  ORF Transcript_23317/g.51247 Transcript_23317/m.51247 type:complete len:173 (-) Transcript_23317:69-587(-)|eukprot:CAMPEP_0206448084 /NCGR_PEP_ID=MMETSP0324_2-20121206/17227_1 /ASSEMBLY_ACC=CAM_ASM_000836 /TAXON_ID=2866 /ORGANISM="Crypthecodinium cohnii, Strain Seligo" /LENGTH=172 /DNA_ID=CAMNT_0053917091 /DNA_START=121 /DNA_END=639 /DNA_ORIENTATION=+
MVTPPCRLTNLFAQYCQQTRAQNSFSSFISKRMQLIKVEDQMKRSTFEIPLHQSDCHPFALARQGQTVHGGVIATIMEDTTTMHICANDPRARKAMTTDMNFSFIGVGKVGRTLSIDSKILKIGGVLGVAEANVKDVSTGKLIAVGRHTMMFIGEDNSSMEFAHSLNSVFDV